MQWPSKNINHGGILHPPKATYNRETHQMLKGNVSDLNNCLILERIQKEVYKTNFMF